IISCTNAGCHAPCREKFLGYRAARLDLSLAMAIQNSMQNASLPKLIVDCHGHVSAPAALWVYKSLLLSHRGEHGKKMPPVSDEELIEALHRKEIGPCGHLEALDRAGTKIQLISPRPFQMMH